MKFLLLLLSTLALSASLAAQTNTCNFGTGADGNCGFYKDAEMKVPVDLDEGALLLNTENRYAYKTLAGKDFNYFLIGMSAATDAEVSLFYDVEFQLLDENGEVAFTQFCGGPEPGVVTDQEVFRNEGATLRIYYAGTKKGNLRFPKIQEMVK